jgi:hypothetical protein
VLRVSQVLGVLWGWSSGGLPHWLILPGFQRRWGREIILTSLPKPEDMRKIHRGRAINLVLARRFALSKTLSVPRKAKAQLAQVVATHIRQSQPSGGRDVVWNYEITKSAPEGIEVTIYIVKRRMLEQLSQLYSVAHLKLRSIRLIGLPEQALLLDNRKMMDRPVRLWGMVTFAAYASLLLLIALEGRARLTALQSQLVEHQTHLSGLLQRQLALQNDAADRDAKAVLFAQNFAALQMGRLHGLILRDLTQHLNDETWISELRLSNGGLRLSGFTKGDVSDIIQGVHTLPWVQGAQLGGPVLFDRQTRSNRFQIRITLRVPEQGT